MKYHTIRKALSILAIMTLGTLVLGGCFRKHIESAPPARRPAAAPAQPQAVPAPKPAVVEEKPEIIEETYIVNAPEENDSPASSVEEGELGAEPAQAAEVVKEQERRIEDGAVQAAKTGETAMSEMYYVQVGAFSDLENANNVLAQLIEQGYKGSKLARTEAGLYRVQAGAFADQASADNALAKLLPEFPKGFVLKSMPEE